MLINCCHSVNIITLVYPKVITLRLSGFHCIWYEMSYPSKAYNQMFYSLLQKSFYVENALFLEGLSTWWDFALHIEPDFDEAKCEWPDFPDFLVRSKACSSVDKNWMWIEENSTTFFLCSQFHQHFMSTFSIDILMPKKYKVKL